MPPPPIKGGPAFCPARTLVVYSLRAPGEKAVRYVGVTRWPRGRWLGHTSEALRLWHAGKPVTQLHRWLLSLYAKGKRPILEPLATSPAWVRRRGCARFDFRAQEAAGRKAGEALEARWIRKLAKRGEPLFNVRGRKQPARAASRRASGASR